jgi:DNA-binding NarL/FixJ family response regulator
MLADDHEIVRTGIKQMLESEQDLQIVAEAANGREAVELALEHQPDVLIMDISMPQMTGIEATQALTQANSPVRVLILSMFDREEYVLNAVKYGAYGYILKDTDKPRFLKAIHKIANGEKYYSSEVSQIIIDQYLHGVTTPEASSPSTQTDTYNRASTYDITKREHEILERIVNGHSNKTISDELQISVRTIETHRLHIMKKLNVNNAADLIRIAIKQQIV